MYISNVALRNIAYTCIIISKLDQHKLYTVCNLHTVYSLRWSTLPLAIPYVTLPAPLTSLYLYRIGNLFRGYLISQISCFRKNYTQKTKICMVHTLFLTNSWNFNPVKYNVYPLYGNSKLQCSYYWYYNRIPCMV